MHTYDLAILGAGESGVGSALLAQSKGLTVWVSDSGKVSQFYARELNNAHIEWEEQGHHYDKILGARQVLKSPGIPHSAPIVQEVLKKGIPLISELDLTQPYSKARVVAITGTNGKTTTTSLIYELFKNAGLRVKVAGNIGKSYAREVWESDPDIMVLEVSSFQLDDSKHFRPHVAVLCNITPDHLDRYNHDYQRYIQSKFSITQNQTETDYFIYCADNPDTVQNLHYATGKAVTLPISYQKQQNPGAHIINQLLTITYPQNKISFTMNTQQFSLKGIHNAYNTMAAAVVGNVFDIKSEVIRDSLSNFKNVEHRLEMVAKVGGVTFINDSKATNVNAAWYALESIQKPIIWIAGGVDKGNDYSLLQELVKDRVKLIICIGADNSKIHQALSAHVDLILNTESMNEAVKTAYRFSSKEDTVLLSPACASFDFYLNYQDRGQAFKRAVRNL